ncbi:MAG TPA: metallophosphoesterase [Candidatus Limiplasma sp.]|nr:metallophosphoesterase [Candidatus Limiplasma sp.]
MGRKKGSYIFFEEKKKHHASGCLILLLAVIFAILALSILSNTLLNQRLTLETEKVRVMNLDSGYNNLTILHISDLHGSEIGFETETWKDLLFGKGFTAVVMTGDMVGAGGDYAPLITLIKTLHEIKADVPIYFIAGDEDPTAVVSELHGSPEPLAEWVRAAQAEGAIYLDRAIGQTVGKKTVWFIPEYLYSIGLTDDAGIKGMVSTLERQKEEMEASGRQYEAEGGASYRALCYRLEAYEESADAIAAMTEDDLQIGVIHVPLDADYVRQMTEWADEDDVFSYRNLSLVLAGHYCGGQWRLGSLGPVYVPDFGWFPGDEGIVGMMRINNISQYISGGLAASGVYPMPMRLFNVPTITLLSYTAKLE